MGSSHLWSMARCVAMQPPTRQAWTLPHLPSQSLPAFQLKQRSLPSGVFDINSWPPLFLSPLFLAPLPVPLLLFLGYPLAVPADCLLSARDRFSPLGWPPEGAD